MKRRIRAHAVATMVAAAAIAAPPAMADEPAPIPHAKSLWPIPLMPATPPVWGKVFTDYVDPRPNSKGAKLETIHLADQVFQVPQYYIFRDHMDRKGGTTISLWIIFLYPSLRPCIQRFLDADNSTNDDNSIVSVMIGYHEGYQADSGIARSHAWGVLPPRAQSLDFGPFKGYRSDVTGDVEYSWETDGKPLGTIKCDDSTVTSTAILTHTPLHPHCNMYYQYNPHMSVDMSFQSYLLHNAENLKRLVDQAISNNAWKRSPNTDSGVDHNGN